MKRSSPRNPSARHSPRRAGGGQVRIGVIGGSGVYDLEGLTDVREVRLRTPFGAPSDAIRVGRYGGIQVAFLPRHGRGHRILPTEINFQANIFALKMIGVEQIIAISACGSLKEEIRPGDFVIPSQLFDRTKSRPWTFYGEGVVGHTSFADPFCGTLSERLHKASQALGFTAHLGGTYVCIEGPMFSTRSESKVYRSYGFDIIGMTGIPEARLAREAEICYATVGMVTDYDVWMEGREVTAQEVMRTFENNVGRAKDLLGKVLPGLERTRTCPCASAAKDVVITARDSLPAKRHRALAPILGRYFT